MLIAFWSRWRTCGRIRWLVLAGLVVILDAFFGSALVAWEIGVLWEVLER